MPIGMAMSIVNVSERVPSRTVYPSRPATSGQTGLFHSSDHPKSPRRKPVIHFRYWTYCGRSSPYCLRSASIVRASWPPPVSAISACSEVKKSPGGNWMMTKVMMETNSSRGMIASTRCTT